MFSGGTETSAEAKGCFQGVQKWNNGFEWVKDLFHQCKQIGENMSW